MKLTIGLALGFSLVSGAIACTAPTLQPTSTSSVSSTLATYKATSETTKKYGITKWRLRNVGDGSVLEGLDAKGKSVSHISIAVRKGAKANAAMFWFSGKESTSRGFVSGNKKGLMKARVPGSLPTWATAARRDLEKFAAEGKTPYGCAEDIFGILGNFLKEAPKCAKTDTLQGCVGKLMQGEQSTSGGPLGNLGGIGGILGNATKLLTSCKPPASSSSSSGATPTASSSSSSSGKTASSSSSGGEDEKEEKDEKSTSSSSSSSSSSGSTSSSSGGKEEEEEEEKPAAEKPAADAEKPAAEDEKPAAETDKPAVEEQNPANQDDTIKEADPVEAEQPEVQEAGEVPSGDESGSMFTSLKHN